MKNKAKEWRYENSSDHDGSFSEPEYPAQHPIQQTRNNTKQQKTPKSESKLKAVESNKPSIKGRFDEDKLHRKIEKNMKRYQKILNTSQNFTQPFDGFQKESLVVEKDPAKVVLVNEKPKSVVYKLLIRSYVVDTGIICPLLLGLAIVIVLIFLTIFLGVKSGQIKEFSIPYGTMYFNQLRRQFSRSLRNSISLQYNDCWAEDSYLSSYKRFNANSKRNCKLFFTFTTQR